MTYQIVPKTEQLPTFDSFDAWEAYGSGLDKARDKYQWLRGEWWNAGNAYGDRVDSVGEQHGVFRNYGVVAKAFDVSRRRDTLPFYAHAEVCVLPENEQEEVLDWAEDTGAKRNEIREEVRFRRSIPVVDNPVLPADKYDLIYADPPWKYDFSKSDSRQIENQYPTMDLQDICNLPISDLAYDNCVLFMWATSPKLKDSMEVLESWGFKYVTCAIWDKEVIGMGYYFRQQHEILLIATKGQPGTPEPSDRISSIIKSKREKHSQKPDLFYGLLESMYPNAKRIELFARQSQPEWSVWGNDPCLS